MMYEANVWQLLHLEQSSERMLVLSVLFDLSVRTMHVCMRACVLACARTHTTRTACALSVFLTLVLGTRALHTRSQCCIL